MSAVQATVQAGHLVIVVRHAVRGYPVRLKRGDRRALPLLKEAATGSLADKRQPVMKQQAAEALEKLGFNSAGRAFELPMGLLEDDLEVIRDILPLQPTA